MQRAVLSFRGEAPRVADDKIPDNASTDATNSRLLTGNLTPWKQFTFTQELVNYPTVETIYRLNGAWLSWDTDVDVARGIIAGDTTFRTYLTGLDAPRFTNYAMATSGAQPYPTTTRLLGVPAPDSVPTTVISVDPTSPNAISVTDDGSNLATSWTTSGLIAGFREVTQDAVIGNPAPSYRLFENNATCFAYRDFGTADSSSTTFTADFYMQAGDGNHQAGFVIGNNSSGAGPRVQIGTNGTNAIFQIGTGVAWATEWAASSTLALTLNGSTWYTMYVTTTANSDGTTTVTAEVKSGATVLGTLTLRQQFSKGGFFGFTTHGTSTDQAFNADNIVVTGSGSLTASTIINLATSYVFTFVNDLGEESAPSLPSATIVRPDGVTVTVTTAISVPTGVNNSDYSITTKRIYRAASGATGTEFLFVAEIPLATANYVDTLTDSELGEVLPSDLWALPPSDLRGILALPNGVMVGFRRNQLCFSAQNQPHAWPVEYRLNTDTDIVGIANVDNTVVIGTKSFVYIAFGNDPANYSMSKFEVPYSAMSKLSFTYLVGIGVVFAGTNGLMAVSGPGQIRNITGPVFTDEQWKALDPSTMRGIAHNDIYFLFWDNGTDRGCYTIDMKSDGFGVVPMGFHASAAYNDPVGDTLFLVLDQVGEPDNALLPIPPTSPHYVDGTHIYEFDSSDTDFMVYQWVSKLWVLERPATMLIAQVRAADFDNIVFRVHADGTVTDEIVVTSDEEFTLTPVDEYTTLQIEILGTSEIRNVQIAEVVEELG